MVGERFVLNYNENCQMLVYIAIYRRFLNPTLSPTFTDSFRFL